MDKNTKKKVWKTPVLKILVKGELGESVLVMCGVQTDPRTGNQYSVSNSSIYG